MPSCQRLIILAAGFGTRLRPITDDRPKALVPLLGRPLLEWQLSAAESVGIRDVIVVGGHCADRLNSYDLAVVRNQRYETTNMVHSLFCARRYFGEGFVLAYGDIAYAPSVLRAVVENNASITVAVDRQWRTYWSERFDDPLSDAETLRLGERGTICEIGRKPSSYDDIEGQYIGLVGFDRRGVQVLSQAYDRLRDAPGGLLDGRPLEKAFMTDLLGELINSGIDLSPAFVDGKWLEIDDHRDLVVAERHASLGRLTD
jgi:L-glutamine-phosphate cytidylyltransferase